MLFFIYLFNFLYCHLFVIFYFIYFIFSGGRGVLTWVLREKRHHTTLLHINLAYIFSAVCCGIHLYCFISICSIFLLSYIYYYIGKRVELSCGLYTLYKNKLTIRLYIEHHSVRCSFFSC